MLEVVLGGAPCRRSTSWGATPAAFTLRRRFSPTHQRGAVTGLRQFRTLAQCPKADAWLSCPLGLLRPLSGDRDVCSASRAPTSNGDQIGELSRDVRHAVFSRAEPVARGKHGAFIVEFIEGGAVNDRHQLASVQQH